MFKTWVAENPEIGISSTGHNVSEAAAMVRRNTPAGRTSQEEGISPLQRESERERERERERDKEEKVRDTESQKSSSSYFLIMGTT